LNCNPKTPGTSAGLESTYVWVEETLGGKCQPYTSLTTNDVILHKEYGAKQEY